MNQPYSQPQGYPQHFQSAPPQLAFPIEKKRNVGMIVGGSILLFLAVIVGGLFIWNLHTYLTVEDRFMEDPTLRMGGRWLVELVKDASMRRMTIFGPVSGLFGIAGLVVGGLGLRKK